MSKASPQLEICQPSLPTSKTETGIWDGVKVWELEWWTRMWEAMKGAVVAAHLFLKWPFQPVSRMCHSLIQKKNVCMQCSLCTVAAQLKLEPARLLSWCSRAWWWCHCWELQTTLYQCVRALCKLCKKLAGNITHMCILLWDQKLLAQGGCVCIVVSTQMYSISCNSHFLSSVFRDVCSVQSGVQLDQEQLGKLVSNPP